MNPGRHLARVAVLALLVVPLAGACRTILGLESAELTEPDAGSTTTSTTATTTSTTATGTTTATSTTTATTTSTGTSSGGTGAACQSSANCDAEHVCSVIGVCLLIDGQPCANVTACDSSFCIDGVCCNAACNTACQACTAVLTGGVNGTCAPAINGSVDPRALCSETAPMTCGTNGKCYQGACSQWPTSTVCGTVPSSCKSVGGDFFVDTKICDGMGTCQPTGSVMCSSAWGCSMDQGSCACGTNADCPAEFPVCNSESECAL